MPAGIACALRAFVCYATGERGVRAMGSATTDTAVLRMAFRALALGVLAASAAGCSHLKWPWHHQPPPPPTAVHVLEVSGSGASVVMAQYWKRNTLVVDVRGAERMVLPIVPAAGKPIDLELPPGVYAPKTAELTVAWGPAASPTT